MPRVFVTRHIPESGLDLLRESCEVDVWEGQLPPPRDEILWRVRDVDGIIPLLTDKVDAEVMDASPNLRVIANYAVGYDNVDIAAATKRGITVTNTPEVLTEATADMAWSLMLAAARRIPESIAYVKSGSWRTWEPGLLLGKDIWGATLGVVGLGRIGSAVARRSSGFNMRVIYTANRESEEALGAGWEHTDLDHLLADSDFVSLHVPLADRTHKLINAETLNKMKPGAVLINTARGPIVDTDALYAALRSNIIGAAALDVTDPEPLPVDHPLFALPNCIVVPHVGSATRATRELMARMAAQNALAVLNGKQPPNPVNEPLEHNI